MTMKLQLNTVNAALSACYGGMQACAITVKRKIRESRLLNRANDALFRFLAASGLVLCATSYNVWSNANIDIETSSATAVNITGISKANPGVVTHSGTDPSNGDYVKLTNIVGMVELNDQVFRVSGAAAGSFNLEGIDTTAMTTFVSGTFEVITFGVSMTTVQDVNSGGGDFQFADLTTIHDTLQKRIPTTASPFTMSLGCLFNPADAAHIELEQANDTKSVRAVRVRWATGAKAVWLAYVGASGIPQGQAQGTVKTAVNFEGQGKPRFYST
jgi:hypothetical protein